MNQSTAHSALPEVPRAYLTSDIAGIGGEIRARPEDFLVEELPLYEPSGEGEHIYLFLEKRDLPTHELLAIIARHFRVKPGAVGYAGLKDRKAITRQVVSVHVPGKRIEDFPHLSHERIGVLWADYHANKLRQGHLKGNRFSIRIRNVSPTSAVAACRVLECLVAHGVPNRFGEQRFGLAGNNHLVGRDLVLGQSTLAVDRVLGPHEGIPHLNAQARSLYEQGKYAEALSAFPRGAHAESCLLRSLARNLSPDQALRTLDDVTLNFWVSAFQSAVFNRVLDERLAAGTLGTLTEGDLACKADNRALFAVDAPTAGSEEIRERLARLEISASGPMWGAGMMRAAGATDACEVRMLEEFGVAPEHLGVFAQQWPRLASGTRRPLRVKVELPDVEGGVDEHGPFVRVAFELPRGAFATVVLREIMKPSDHAGLDDE